MREVLRQDYINGSGKIYSSTFLADLTVADGDRNWISFVGPDYDGQELLETRRTISITREIWEEFGEPEVLTVTLEAGDLLNETDEEDDDE